MLLNLLLYKHFKNEKVVFIVIYVNEILFENDERMFTSVKVWLVKRFDMKDLGEANYILGIQLFGDWNNIMIAQSQSSYIRVWEISKARFQ